MKRLILLLLAAALAVGASSGIAMAAADKKKGGGESFLQMPTLAAGIFGAGGGSRGVLTIDIGLDIPDAKFRQEAMTYRPLLQDAFTRYVLSYAASLKRGAPPDPDVLGRALQRITDETLKRPGAVVLLGTILIN